MEYPKVSIITPTLNAGTVLEKCYSSITKLDYPKDKIELIVADGGSTDNTLEIAKKYGALIIKNPLKTGESGKMVALKSASGEFVALIDSDNVLTTTDWLNRMIIPLIDNPDIPGSEPWEYIRRDTDGFIDRYSALTGVNDPFVLFVGNYDRINTLSGKWTELPHEEFDKGDYLICKFSGDALPTIGANGTVFRKSFLDAVVKGDYLFDIDILFSVLRTTGHVEFIKVKNGIVHLYCGSDILKFARKQRRRITDLFFHLYVKNDRENAWYSKETSELRNKQILKFIVYCVTFFPLLFQSVYGYIKKPDFAWFFHILACEITLWEYGLGVIRSKFHTSELNRDNWKQ